MENKIDWTLTIDTPKKMEAFLKDFNNEAIAYYQYLNDMESTLNKQKDILIKSRELNKDFTLKQDILIDSSDELDYSRDAEIKKVRAELDAEILKSNDTKKLIDETILKLQKGFLLVDGYQKNSPEVVKKSSFKSYTNKYNRLKPEVDTIDIVTGKDLVKEYDIVLKESETFANSITVKEGELAGSNELKRTRA